MAAGVFDILVVDDEPVILDAAKKILVAEGLELAVAQDAETALERVSCNRYRVVLCDLVLPGVRGLELVVSVQHHLPGAPVILITGYATLENAIAGFKGGVFDFIPKPFDDGELLGVARRALDFAGSDRIEMRAPSADDSGVEMFALGQHAWVVPKPDGSARIGMGETFTVLDEKPDEVTLPAVGEAVLQGNQCARWITGGQLVHRLWSPLSGQVVRTNADLFAHPAKNDPEAIYESWVIDMIPSDPEVELSKLTRR